MSILVGSLILVAVVGVLPIVAVVGAVYVQWLMETRPPRDAHRVRTQERLSEERAGGLGADAVPVKA